MRLCISCQQDWVKVHLQVQLNHTIVHEDGGVVPRRGARPGLGALEDHCDTLQLRVDHDDRERIIRQVLHLCLALWGDLKALSGESTLKIGLVVDCLLDLE